MIRQATMGDFEVLIELVKAYDDEVEEVSSISQAPAETILNGILYGIQNHQPILVDEEDGTIRSAIVMTNLPTLPDTTVIGLMAYTRPEFRGQGIVPRMREAAEDMAARMGFTEYVAEVAASNIAGVKSLMKMEGGEIASYIIRKDLRQKEAEQWAYRQ